MTKLPDNNQRQCAKFNENMNIVQSILKCFTGSMFLFGSSVAGGLSGTDSCGCRIGQEAKRVGYIISGVEINLMNTN